MTSPLRRTRLRPTDLLRLGMIGPRTRKMRSALSALGISLGIAAVIAVTGISSSNQAHLLARLDQLGSNLITVSPGKDPDQQLVPLPPTAEKMLANIAPVQQVTATGVPRPRSTATSWCRRSRPAASPSSPPG
ncbi:ABC transporter permease [Streptomyces sp. SBC-4]|nr:ABC transporter permease [Streptomyces sp. SBC-4]MDV5150037.1 ABC transporter permease [Streptomyces sp. SBC-4]